MKHVRFMKTFSINRGNLRLIWSLGWEMDTFNSSAVISIFLRDSVSLPLLSTELLKKLKKFLNLIIEQITLNQQTFKKSVQISFTRFLHKITTEVRFISSQGVNEFTGLQNDIGNTRANRTQLETDSVFEALPLYYYLL